MRTVTVDVPKKNIEPCRGCGYCEKKGVCIIDDDDMTGEIYDLLREAEIVVLASPVFFYNVTAQIKALIDRSQTLWSRKYRFRLSDPLKKRRKGCLLSMGGSGGRQLFDGVHLVAKYFFDAIDADFAGSITYRNVEDRQAMLKVPGLDEDIETFIADKLVPAEPRKKILFACRENACRSQMAGAFATILGGDRLDVMTAGSAPVQALNPLMVRAMAEKGIDMAFHRPRELNQVIETSKPEIIVTMGCGEECPYIPGVERLDWDLPDPSEKPLAFMNEVRDRIEKKVSELVSEY